MSELALLITIITVLLTLFIVLLERKFLAYAQRRMGPTIMGRNGAFQIALDLVKLLSKEIFLIPRPSSMAAPIFLSFLFATQLSFSQIFIWGPSFYLNSNADALILYYIILILLSNIFFVLVGFLSQSRYALLGTIRALIHVLSLDIFITVIYAILILTAQSSNFHDFVIAQNQYWNIVLYAPLAFVFILLLLLESKRAPFDHAETESEVVAGYAVEYSGSMLLIFFLAEYLHLLISSVSFTLFFLGGWTSLKIWSFLPPMFLTHFDLFLWWNIF